MNERRQRLGARLGTTTPLAVAVRVTLTVPSCLMGRVDLKETSTACGVPIVADLSPGHIPCA